MIVPVNAFALAATAFIAFTTASPVAPPTNSSLVFFEGLSPGVAPNDVLKYLENTGTIKWVPAPGGGFTVSIEEGTWHQGVAGAAANASHRRSVIDSPLASRGSTGLIDGLAGSINCYGSGSSDMDSAISTFTGQACNALIALLLPPHAKVAAKGAYQLWKSGQTTDSNNDLSYIKFGAKFLTSSWTSVDTTLCEDAYDVYSTYCQDKDSASTKGGVLSLGDVIQFTLDPTQD